MNWLCKLLTAAALLAVSTLAIPASELSARVNAELGGDFTLHSPEGPVSLAQYRGQVVLIFFGFTSCPDICPIALSVMSRVFGELDAAELARVRALFVSLDPGRDTPEVLKKYTGYFHPNIVGVTDRIETVTRVAADYGIQFEKKERASSPIGYVISHPPDILVVNQQGQLLTSRIKPEHGADEIVTFVRQLLSAGG